ncbi:stromal cell-derived factor 2-like [Macrosteles quadrilineatus]|uniref:stromal cell-derived factor 2-like n=1 Tax=Macrosteles quadrilineatus TaxID=74068 RepID=UPI0023E32D46|nr:stromal cell-derived factor 2-like [Macrosteles quadrilineatus]
MRNFQNSCSYRIYYCIGFLCCLLSINNVYGKAGEFVTIGSVLKLLNTDYKVRLHSHDVKYGTGSGQQSVTGTESQEDVNSHWVIRGETKKLVSRGEPVKCGSVVRLTHLATNKNLHSHHFSSPLSGNQEVSAYGTDGDGDTGDHWIVICDGDFWERDEKVMLKHVDTDVYLSVTSNTYGRPINGQYEIVGVQWPNSNPVHWKALEGLFIHPSDFNPKKQVHIEHTEL